MRRLVRLDAHGAILGTIGKLAAHAPPGTRHLAFSVLLFDDRGRLLVQQRQRSKYHFGGRWSNSCCSHPGPGEPVTAAAQRRVRSELGVSVTALEPVGAFWYRAVDPSNGLVEHELDVVLRGRLSSDPAPDRAEIDRVAWWDPGRAQDLCTGSPELVTPWFARALEMASGTASEIPGSFPV